MIVDEQAFTELFAQSCCFLLFFSDWFSVDTRSSVGELNE